VEIAQASGATLTTTQVDQTNTRIISKPAVIISSVAKKFKFQKREKLSCFVISVYKTCYQKNLKVMIYRTLILPVVLYGCETWSLTLREERRLRVFENRVLRRDNRGMEKTT
jgi:hypothetical protein